MENTQTDFCRTKRIAALDTLRGAAIIFVVVYHLLYDLVIFGADIGFFYSEAMEAVHFFFLAVLMCVSGICTAFSRNIFKRGAVIYLLGEGITVVTSLLMPSERIVFGVLSFFGLMMLIYGVCKPALDKLNPYVMLAVWVVLYIIFRDFSSEQVIQLGFTDITVRATPAAAEYLYPLGITAPAFSSADYFAIIPWGFIFMAGTALSGPVSQRKLPKLFYEIKCPPIDFLGRNTLIIYVLHQPILYGIVWLVFTYII